MTTTRTALLLASLASFASLGMLSGCANNAPSEPTPSSGAGASAPTKAVEPKTVDMTKSDLAPSALQPRPGLTVPMQLVQVTQATSPREPIDFGVGIPQMVATTESLTFHDKTSTALVEHLEVDSTAGESYLFLTPQLTDSAAINEALRGIKVFDPSGVQVNLRDAKMIAGEAPTEHLPMSMISLAQHGSGTYTVKLDPKAAKTGVAFDLRQPLSPIKMQMKPSVVQHLLGNDGTVDVWLDDASAPIAGATLTATLLDPTLKPVRPLVFTDVGQGHYQASLGGSTFDRADPIGAWLVDIQADGTAPSGAKFHRSGRVGFHFGIPTAKIASVGATRVLRDAKGLVSGFEVDVDVDCTALDRLELQATLAARGDDGYEHAVAVAFTGAGYDVGHHTLTLHFDAGYAKLTHLSGAFTLRNMSLFSLGTNTLFQRIGEVKVAPFAPVSLPEIAPLQTITPGVASLIKDGILFSE